MARGSRKKQVETDKSGETTKNGKGHNSALTPDQEHALHIAHTKEYLVAKAALDKAQADIKNLGKRIKSEGGSVAQVKKSIQAQTPEGEKALKAEMEATAQVLRWAGVEVGETGQLFPTGAPAEEKAFNYGKIAGMKGDDCRPPYDPSVPQYQRWMDGWAAAQEILLSGFREKVTPKEDVPAEHTPQDTSSAPFAAPAEQQAAH